MTLGEAIDVEDARQHQNAAIAAWIADRALRYGVSVYFEDSPPGLPDCFLWSWDGGNGYGIVGPGYVVLPELDGWQQLLHDVGHAATETDDEDVVVGWTTAFLLYEFGDDAAMVVAMYLEDMQADIPSWDVCLLAARKAGVLDDQFLPITRN